MNLTSAAKTILKPGSTPAPNYKCSGRAQHHQSAQISAVFGALVLCLLLGTACDVSRKAPAPVSGARDMSRSGEALISEPVGSAESGSVAEPETLDTARDSLTSKIKALVEISYKVGVRDGILIENHGLWRDKTEAEKEEAAWSGYKDAVNAIQ